MIFQDFNLFDHLCALDNVEIGLVRVKGLEKKTARERAMLELERVGLAIMPITIPPNFREDRSRGFPSPGPSHGPEGHAARRTHLGPRPGTDRRGVDSNQKPGRNGMTMIMATHQIGSRGSGR